MAAQLLPHNEQDGPRQRLSMGQLLELTVAAAGADGVLARLADGRLLRLLSLEGSLRQGDVLLLRVLSASPKLELALLKTIAAGTPAPSSPDAEPAAMRLDQATLRQQVAIPTQDAGTLALSWRAMVLAQLEQQLLLRAQASGQHVPGSLFGSDAGATLLREMPRMLPGVEMASWMFSAYVWTGRQVLLSLLASEEDARPRRRRANITLRLQLTLPGLGTIKLQLRLAAGGIWLDLAAEQDVALTFLRRALRQIVAAVARAELRVVRCRLGRVLPASGSAIDLALAANASSELVFSPALFRAAAELALLLSNPLRPALADRADDTDLALLRDLVIR
ncbi:MAG TPA: flagellar hook-length control protein FliK [Burkholderiaceae bacterium]|nr:flagellar hook-length control protein FliK [Burkholderiaceae bacterium]